MAAGAAAAQQHRGRQQGRRHVLVVDRGEQPALDQPCRPPGAPPRPTASLPPRLRLDPNERRTQRCPAASSPPHRPAARATIGCRSGSTCRRRRRAAPPLSATSAVSVTVRLSKVTIRAASATTPSSRSDAHMRQDLARSRCATARGAAARRMPASHAAGIRSPIAPIARAPAARVNYAGRDRS